MRIFLNELIIFGIIFSKTNYANNIKVYFILFYFFHFDNLSFIKNKKLKINGVDEGGENEEAWATKLLSKSNESVNGGSNMKCMA